MDLIKTFQPFIDDQLNGFFLNKDEMMISRLKCQLIVQSDDNGISKSQKGSLYLCSQCVLFVPKDKLVGILKYKLSDQIELVLNNRCGLDNQTNEQLNELLDCPYKHQQKQVDGSYTTISIETNIFQIANRNQTSSYLSYQNHHRHLLVVQDRLEKIAEFVNNLQLILQSEDDQEFDDIITKRLQQKMEQLEYGFQIKEVQIDCEYWSNKYLLIERLIGGFHLNQKTKLNFKQISFVVKTKYKLDDVCLIIFSNEGQLKIVFQNRNEREQFYSVLLKQCNSLQNLRTGKFIEQGEEQNLDLVYQEQVEEVMNWYQIEWKENRISNFEYLLLLNHLSGRSFVDLSEYPVFPWLVNCYDTSDFNQIVDNNQNLRDLDKPLCIQNKFNKQKLELLTKKKESYYCASMFSNLSISQYYLLRKYPWLVMRMGNTVYRVQDIVFSSIQDVYEYTVIQGNDFKELIPEFFWDDSIFANNYNLELGEKTENQVINDVEMPQWTSSIKDYVLKMRSVLESNMVSQSIHQWIDLVFGVAQQDASKFNTFKQENIKAIIDQVGVFPQQLFKQQHPQKERLKSIRNLGSEVGCELDISEKSNDDIFENMVILANMKK